MTRKTGTATAKVRKVTGPVRGWMYYACKGTVIAFTADPKLAAAFMGGDMGCKLTLGTWTPDRTPTGKQPRTRTKKKGTR